MLNSYFAVLTALFTGVWRFSIGEENVERPRREIRQYGVSIAAERDE
jgi:hypothetical protein